MEKQTTYPMAELLGGVAGLIASHPANGEQSAITDANNYVRQKLRESAVERYEKICPQAYRETDFNHPGLADYRAQIDAVIRWNFNPRGIIASGATGRGKTRAMWELYRRITCDDVVDARFWHATDWFTTLQLQMSYGRDEAQGWIEAVAARRVVFIDDFGQAAIAATKTEWAAGWFFRFLDMRVGKKLPLIISTNLHADEFSGRLRGDPMLRRILDVCEPVKF